MLRSQSTRVAICAALSLSPYFAFAQTSASISVVPRASNAPVSAPLDPSFAGFGIEPSNLFSFTGNEETNQFSIKLLQNLADYAGKPPHIRLGGNTQDYMIYDATYTAFGWEANANSQSQGAIAADSIIVGPGYIEALDRFPKDTPVTFGLNMAYSSADYLDQIVKTAQAAVDGIKNVKLYSFEIGNEPDLFLQNQMRSGSWGGQVYTEEFLTRAAAVYQQVLQPAGITSTFFEAPATASTIGTTFEIEDLVAAGLLNGTNGVEYVNVWNQHDYFYFIGVTQRPIVLNDLMRLRATEVQFAYWEQQAAIGLNTGLPYVLREMSSVGPIGMHEISDTFGAALWTLNFLLYTATLNISSVQMHMTDNSNASAWQPRAMYGRNTFVRPQYYAHAAIAQIIGHGNGTTQIGNLSIGNTDLDYQGYLRAYSTYSGGNLQSVVLINSKMANASLSDKNSFTFNLNLGNENRNKDIYLSYLTADGADSLEGATFNGLTYSDTTGQASSVSATGDTLRTSSSGSVSIPVRDSQAVVANFGSVLGANAVIAGNGTTGKKSGAPTRTAGSRTAVWTGVATTTLMLASSVTSGGRAEETGRSSEGEVGARRRGSTLLMMGVCLLGVVVGFVYLA